MDMGEKKISEARERATKKYVAKQYRPSVYINKDKQKLIESHFKEKGFKTFNEYVIALIDEDMNNE